MNDSKRYDLSATTLTRLLAGLALIVLAIGVYPGWSAPGSSSGQLAGAAGALLLLAPALYLVGKRSGRGASPPTGFILHLLAAEAGCILVFVHAAAGDWLSPPGLVLLLMALLIVQGSLLRIRVAPRYSRLFAGNSRADGFGVPAGLDKAALRALIDAKAGLLRRLDAGADEALFSPALHHWVRHPLLSFEYQRLAEREAAMVGARASAGRDLAWPRRIHMALALLFYLGLATHVVVVLFFAGYAADGGAIDWWHIAAWGAAQ